MAFGRVYTTNYNSKSGLLLSRDQVYEYGFSYEEFIRLNHAPLHSFMLDVQRLDLSNVVYFDDQRYMEDYLLTLQLFTKDNCDWESLKLNHYIGDYIHSHDREHTLAHFNDEDRKAILENDEYIYCEERIHQMRNSIQKRLGN